MKRFVILGLLVIAVVGFLPSVAQAQSAETINSFNSSIEIDQAGTAVITETIEYDFGSNQKRGIFRDIPIQYPVVDNMGYKAEAEVLFVQRDGVSDEFILFYDDPSYVRVRVGNPSIYIDGVHTYIIRYSLGPIAIQSDDGSSAIVRFDVPGTGWDASTSSATIQVKTPAPALQTACYQGFSGSTKQDCNKVSLNTFSSSRGLFPAETITAEFSYPLDTFNTYAAYTELEGPYQPPVWLILGPLILVFPIVSLLILRPFIIHMLYKRRRKQELVIALYEPPKEMGPAELGLLIDNSSSGAELSATIIDLAVNGQLKIIQTAEKKWYQGAKYDFEKTDSKKELTRNYDKLLFEAFFKDGDKISSSDLASSISFKTANTKFHKQLKTNLEKLGFYKKLNIFKGNLKGKMSDAGYKKWAEVEGFREFLQVTEAERMAFHDAPEKKPEQFSQFLPYAVAMGVEKQWAEQFKNLSIDTSGWYVGSNTSSLLLVGSIASLSSGLGSVAASANRSSGGSSVGGGFSGGGFSGGGGGSW